jgi:outer membrane autotransporter protein
MDIGLHLPAKTPLALLMATLFSFPALAADFNVPNSGNDTHTVNGGTNWTGNASIGNNAIGEIIIDGNSTWQGNGQILAEAEGDITISDDSLWQGNLNIDGTGGSGGNATVNVTLDDSKWVGDATIANNVESEITLGNGSRWEGNAQIGSDTQAGISLSDNSHWQGNLEVSGANDSYGNVTLENSTWAGNAQIGTDAIGFIYVLDGSDWQGQLSGGGAVDSKAYVALENASWTGRAEDINELDISGINAEINADISMLSHDASLNMELSNGSRYQGNITLTGDESGGNIGFIDLRFDNSDWNGGNLVTDYADIDIVTENGSTTTFSMDATNTNFGVTLESDSVWIGDVTTISNGNEDNSHDVSLTESRWTGDLISHFDGTNGTDFKTGVNLNESKWFGNYTLTSDNVTSSDVGLDVYLEENSQWQGHVTVTDMAEVFIRLRDDSNWQGNIEITADNPSTSAGIDREIQIDGSKWTGHVIDNGADVVLTLDEAEWRITGDSRISLLDATGNNSIIFHSPNPGRDYHTLTVDDLSGDLDFVMRAGYYGPGDYGNDKLIITGDKSSSGTPISNNTLTVLNNGSDFTHGTEVITMVETNDGMDQFTLTTGSVELGGYVYSLEQSGNNWILRPGAKGGTWQPGISKPADAAANTVNANYLMTYAETQTLYQRMGDLRHSQAEGDVWVRGYHGGFNKFSGGLMSGFEMNYNGIQLGADKKIALQGGQIYFGTMLGMTKATLDYETGDGTAKSQHVGVYGSYLSTGGFYVDGLIKYNRLKNDFSVADSMGVGVSGKGTSNGFSASVETGQRFYLSEQSRGFYLEPQLQFSATRQGSDKINLSNGLKVKTDSYTSLQGRAGIQLGFDAFEGISPTNIYFKSSYVKEFDGKTHYTLNSSQEEHSFKGDWWVNGVGVSTQPFANHNFYLDMEKSTGDSFDQHQINVGYRYSF